MKVWTISQAARFVDRVGFCLLFPIKGLRLPSLWAAVKGRSPRRFDLIAEWDADTERLWGWKDELPRRRLAYFGGYFRGRKSLLSLAFLPCFYRLENNYSTPDEYQQLSRDGRINPDSHALPPAVLPHLPPP